ncbi:unnamed protein product [Camellia sinensis]
MSFKIVITVFFVLVLPLEVSSSEPKTWINAGYWYSGGESPVPDIDSTLFTHLLCAFAYINSSTYELSIPSSAEQYFSTFTNIVKQKNPSVITILSIRDGTTNSSIFFSMVSQASHRKTFIQSTIKIARLYGFQGIDMWGVSLSTDMNMTNMGTLFDEWRAAINSESTSSRLILIMSGHYSPVVDSDKYPVKSVERNLDWVHIIAYDYYLSKRDNFTGGHAALYDPSSNLNTDYGIKEWIGIGLPASKMVLGLAYHGYAWTLVNPKENGIGAPARGLAITQDGSMSYKYIKGYMKSYKLASMYNATYVVNYCTFGLFWIGFDDVEAIRTKVSYAKDKGLLGYAVWQVPNDDNWVLTKADSRRRQKTRKQEMVISDSASYNLCTYFPTRHSIVVFAERGTQKERIMATGKKSESPNLQVFSFADIKAVTNNFSSENKLGQGGFGPVYKGKLPDGQEIAVKRLSETSRQGVEEYKNEVSLTAKLQHVNLVRLLGFCTEREEKLLIYEYMPNKSLDFYLYDPDGRPLLDWEKWLHIIEGVTQGLLYLQEYSRFTIVHRDLKASNILLDKDMKPKISDFGIARIFQKDEHEANTSHIVGTYGCVPPEYVKQGTYSTKYDVYSFGVLLLQIISEYAYELWKDGKGMDFMDPLLDDSSSSCKLMRCMQVALLCVQEKWQERLSMLEVSSMLKNETEMVPIPQRPAFSTKKDKEEENNLTLRQQTCSVDDATISEVVPR